MLTYVKSIFVWAVITKKKRIRKIACTNSANSAEHSVYCLAHDVTADTSVNLFSSQITSIKIMPLCTFSTEQDAK
jgi:hypothetical protein